MRRRRTGYRKPSAQRNPGTLPGDPPPPAPVTPGPDEEARRRALLFMLEDLEEDRRKIEQARREWTRAFDAIRDLVFIHDANYRIVRANRAYAERAGGDFAGILGRPYWEIFPRRSGPLPRCQVATEDRQDSITEEFTLDTGEIFVSRSFVIRDAGHRFLYAVHVLEDVTQPRRAETERRMLSEALRQSAAGLILLNPDLSFRYANPAACALVGYEPGQLDGLPLAAVVPEGVHERTPAIQAAVDATGHWTGEIMLAARDGTPIPAYLSASIIAGADGTTLAYVGSWLDLRPIKQAQEALAASEIRFRLLAENASDLVAVVATNGEVLYISPSVQRLLGYSREEVIGRSMFEFLHPDEIAAAQAAETRGIADPAIVQTLTHRLRHKDGSWRYFETLGRNLLHEPVIHGLVLNSREITKRVQAEAALRVSRDLLSSIVENIPTRVFWKDTRLRYLGSNTLFARDAGKPRPEELIGKDDFQMGWRDQAELYRADDKRVMDSDTPKLGFEEPQTTPDGRTIWLRTSKVPLHDAGGRVFGVLGIYDDITERKQMEAALRESEEKFRALVETTTDWIWQVDEHGVYTYASPQVRGILGYEPDEIVGKTPFDLMPPSEAGRVREVFESVVANRKPFFLLENANLHKSGRTVVLETSGSPLFDETGAYKGCRGIDRDITARKQMEEALRRSNRALKSLSAGNTVLVHAGGEPELLEQICRVIVEFGGYLLAWVGYTVPGGGGIVRPVAGAGSEKGEIESFYLAWEGGAADWGLTDRIFPGELPVIVRNIRADPEFLSLREGALKGGYDSFVALPLRKEHEPAFGALYIYAAESNAFDEEEVRLLAEMADDLAFGVLTLRTRAEHQRLQEEHLKSAERLKETLTDTIRAVALTVEKRDPYTAGHQNNVADLCAAIGREMGLPEDRIEGMRLGALIHDIGKVYVPAEILNRPGKLSAAEFEIIKSHPEVGYDIVKDVKFPWPVAETIRQHHERLDGSGYPRGLKGEAIILDARILAVADVVEAMASHRPYRPARGIEAALAEIERHRGVWYDPAAVDACLRLFREKRFAFG